MSVTKFGFSMFLVVFISYAANAQKNVDVKEVEISASRVEVEFGKTARNVILITQEDIENSSATSINELLEFAAGVDIRQRGQQGVQADLSIRGSSFEQVLVLLNGVKMTDPQTGHHALNLPISLLDVDRIEVLHGGAARIYGPGAFAGAINIITKTPETNQAKVELLVGQFGLRQVGVSAAIVEKSQNHRISFQNQTSDGFIRNTDYVSKSIFWESNVQLKKIKVTLNLGQNEKEFGAQNFYTARFPEQFEATKTQFAALATSREKGNLKIKAQGYYRVHNDRFELFREDEGFYRRTVESGFVNNLGDTIPWYTFHNYHQTQVYGAEWNASYSSILGKTSFGYDFRREELLSNNLGQDLSEQIAVKNEVPSAFYTKSDERENHNFYIEHTYSTDNLFISAGALYNVNSDFKNGFYPGIEAAFQLNDLFRLYANADQSFRFPSFTDLYYNLGGALGSENLQPEESVNYELGMKIQQKSGFGHIGVFKRDGSNLIDWVRLNGSTNTQATNLTNVIVIGTEVDYYLNLRKALQSNVLENLKISYGYLSSDNRSSGFESNYVLDFLRHKADLGLQIKLAENFVINWNTSFQQRRGEYIDATGVEIKFVPILLSDVKLSVNRELVNIFLQASNVFNQKFVDIGNVQNPGLWISAGLKYQLNLSK